MEKDNKITIQEVAPYIDYCQVAITSIVQDGISWEEPLLGVDLAENVIITDVDSYGFDDIIEWKLILRSIEDMTEEEKKELQNRVGLEIEDLVAITHGKVMHLVYLSEMVSIVNYLRSIGVDCDNLIQSGKAIRKQ